jgi:hypothetical protein
VSSREREPREEPPRDEASQEGPAFRDDLSGRVTLTFGGPPLDLPRELVEHEARALRAARAEPAHLDAWSADRLRRSSLPPSAESSAAVSVFPQPRVAEAQAGAGDEIFESDLLALVSRARPMQALDVATEMTERFSLGDFSGALRAAELLLGQQPDHELAQHYARESRAKLEDMYTSRLEAQGRVLHVAVPASEIAWLGLDPHLTALLAQVDGESDYEAVLAQSSMPRIAALRALVELLEARVIRLV